MHHGASEMVKAQRKALRFQFGLASGACRRALDQNYIYIVDGPTSLTAFVRRSSIVAFFAALATIDATARNNDIYNIKINRNENDLN